MTPNEIEGLQLRYELALNGRREATVRANALDAELAACRAGYDAMNRRIYGPRGECFELEKARARITALELNNRALREYARHADSCGDHALGYSECGCGLDVVFAALTPATSDRGAK